MAHDAATRRRRLGSVERNLHALARQLWVSVSRNRVPQQHCAAANRSTYRQTRVTRQSTPFLPVSSFTSYLVMPSSRLGRLTSTSRRHARSFSSVWTLDAETVKKRLGHDGAVDSSTCWLVVPVASGALLVGCVRRHVQYTRRQSHGGMPSTESTMSRNGPIVTGSAAAETVSAGGLPASRSRAGRARVALSSGSRPGSHGVRRSPMAMISWRLAHT
jgi:hypothetical protein